MNKIKYQPSLLTIQKPISKKIITTSKLFEYDSLSAQKTKEKQVELFKLKIHKLLTNAATTVSHEITDFVIESFRLEDPDNFNQFEKNIKDGYAIYYYYLYVNIPLRSYDLKYIKDQTTGINNFIKLFTPKSRKKLINIPASNQIFLLNFLTCTNKIELLDIALSSGLCFAGIHRAGQQLDHYYSLVINHYGDQVKVKKYFSFYCEQLKLSFDNHVSWTAPIEQDIWDHLHMHKSLVDFQKKYLTVYQDKYPELFKDIGICFSDKWSLRRFKNEHNKLSILAREASLFHQYIAIEQNKWRKNYFFNINNFSELLDFTLDVNGVHLKVNLINNTKQLLEEAKRMGHCIFSYNNRMLKGNYIAFSITDLENKKNNATLGFNIINIPPRGPFTKEETNAPIFDQLRGYKNSTDFTISVSDLIILILDKLKSIGFIKYLKEKHQRPLRYIKVAEKYKSFFTHHPFGEKYHLIENSFVNAGRFPRSTIFDKPRQHFLFFKLKPTAFPYKEKSKEKQLPIILPVTV